MSTTLTREQLPTKTCSFIAYAGEVRLNNPATNTPVTMRAQTFVQYYRDITVASVGKGRSDGVIRVEFDPSSVGFKDPIAANLDPDDALVDVVRTAQQQGTPVDVAFEMIRKQKDKADNSVIDPFRHIHALRGATHPSGKGASMNRSGDTTRKMLVMVNGMPGKALTSDPTEWAALMNNKEGNLPPEGWQLLSPGTDNGGDDWGSISAIIPDHENPARGAGATGGGSAIDMNALGSLIEKVLNHVLDQRDNGGAGNIAREIKKGRAQEGTRFEARTSDGQVNLSTYAATGLARIYSWAHTYAMNAGLGNDPEGLWSLTDNLAKVTDRVQETAYHGKIPANRDKYSWTQIFKWITHTIETSHPLTTLAPEGAYFAAVADATLPHIAQMSKLTGEHYAARAARQKELDSRKADASVQGPTKEEQIAHLLKQAKGAWNSVPGLQSTYKRAQEADMIDLPVSLGQDEKGKPELAHPPVADQQSGDLGSLLHWRAGQVQSAQQQQTPTQQAKAPASQGQDTTTQQQETASPQVPAPTMSHELSAYMERLTQRATQGFTPDTLRAAFETAKKQNLLMSQVTATVTNGTIVYDPNAKPITVGDILNQLTATPATSTPSAQDLADAAQNGDANEVQRIKKQALEANLGGETVTVGGVSGDLLSYLNSRLS